jgi:hypothetical protein
LHAEREQLTFCSNQPLSLVIGWNIIPAHAAGLSPAHSIWVGSGPAQFFFFVKKYFFGIFTIFPRIFYVILINIKQYFNVAKNTKSDIKIPGFHQNFQNTKQF